MIIKHISLALLLLGASNLVVADKYLYDNYGKRGLKIEDDGTIKDKYGRRQGSIDEDGYFRDNRGRRDGQIREDGTIVQTSTLYLIN